MPPTKPKPAVVTKPTKGEERPIIHPSVFCVVRDGDMEQPGHDRPVSVQDARDFLGWEEFEGDAEPLLVDEFGKKIKCTNNQSNRPFDESRMDQYAQDVLCRRWAGPHGNGKSVNGEAMIIGRQGQTLSCQHRLIALVIAGQRWTKDEHWRSNWPKEPVMDSVMTFGVDESGDTTITIDNVKPRTGADVFFADPSIFSGDPRSERKDKCKILDYGVKTIWHRGGLKQDAYAPRRTHSEAKDFIKRHPRIQRCVSHVFEQDQSGSLSRLIPLGTASGLMYLQGSARSEREKYVETFSEKPLDWELWDKAVDFWTHLSVSQTKQGDEGFRRLRKAVEYLSDQNGGGGGSSEKKVALIVKGWLCFSAGLPLTDKNLGYEYAELSIDGSKEKLKIMTQNGLVLDDEKDADGNLIPLGSRRLEEIPSCGGIDLGDPEETAREERERVREAAKADKQRQKDAAAALKAQDKANAKVAAPAESLSDILARIHKDYPGELLVWPRIAGEDGEGVDVGAFDIAGSDALIAAGKLGLKTELKNELQFIRIAKNDVAKSMDKLKKAGLSIGWCGKERSKDGVIRMNYLGTYVSPGGYENKPEEVSPQPAAPVTPTTKPKAKPVEPDPKPKTKPAVKPAKALRGGTK